MEKREIILTRGIQASGKSTYAEHWAKEKPTERIRINWDSLRKDGYTRSYTSLVRVVNKWIKPEIKQKQAKKPNL